MQTLFDTWADCVAAAHWQSRRVAAGVAYAVQWPLGHFTVEYVKPSLRDHRMRVIECADGRELLA